MRKAWFWMIMLLLAACNGGQSSAGNAPVAQITLPDYMRQGYETYHETGGVVRPANAVDVFTG